MENFFDNQRILRSIWKWRIHICVVVVLAIAVSAFISSPVCITPKYKSVAKLYPVNISGYSEESESEQLLELISGNDIKFKIIDAFDLMSVYKINPEDPLSQTYVLDQYNSNVTFNKTKFESVEVKVLDKDPNRACNMADSIIKFFDYKMQHLHGAKYYEVYSIAVRDIAQQNEEADSLRLVMNDLVQKYGLFNYNMQLKAASDGLMEAASRNGSQKPANELLSNLKEKGLELEKVQRMLARNERMIDSLSVIRDFSYSSATKKITYTIVADKPFPADKKSYPIRWLIVFLSTFSALLLSIVTVVTIDYFCAKKAE